MKNNAKKKLTHTTNLRRECLQNHGSLYEPRRTSDFYRCGIERGCFPSSLEVFSRNPNRKQNKKIIDIRHPII